MAAAAGSGLMLPEQVWDGHHRRAAPRPRPARARSARRRLAWSHAQFVRLALSIDAGAPVERPAIVACRYAIVCR